MKEKTLKEYTEEIVKVYKSYEQIGTTPWNYSIAARDLTYQLGSLTKILLQLEGSRYAKGKTEKELKTDLADELADILAETLFIAHDMNLSLDEAWDRMRDSDEKKILERIGTN
jgi:NTP pyrophosphatase (non-canonical NTP hydrolase)